MLLLTIISVASSNAFPSSKGVKNILLINSYHQGFMWTDSLTSGIVTAIKQYPEYNLYVEYLNSKKFGATNFEIEKNYIGQKYAAISFAGVLVTDNDALDFAIQYEKELFPNVPVVFAGISNPEDYLLEGSSYFGFKETSCTNVILDFVQKLVPKARRLLIITDHTNTGMIYRNEFMKQARLKKNLQLFFPETIELDSVYRLAGSENEFDAIYYIGIGKNKSGELVDLFAVGKKLCQVVKVPLFASDPRFNGDGVVGGLYLSGWKNGLEAANLLIDLLNSERWDTIKHVQAIELEYFFDRKMLAKYGISDKVIPKGSHIVNKKILMSEENYKLLVIFLVVLSLLTIILSVVNRKRRTAHEQSKAQLSKIEAQKEELEAAYMQLSGVISELETANERLNKTNSDLLEAKKKAEESDNLKSAFLANVSHEIRTPLNSIVGFSSLLSESGLDEEIRKSYIGLIESNTESLLVLIDEIIDLSKIEAQQLSIKKQHFSIDSLMVELFQIFNRDQKDSKLELLTQKISETSELIIYSDRVRVKQVFINLLSNAFKFTDSGTIEFGYFFSESNGVVLYVKDTGIGISKEFHKAIFHRFRKLNENSAKIFRGTGLGLAITQRLVELLGGKIWLESEPGKGTVFYFTLDGLALSDVAEQKNQPELVQNL